MRRPIIITLVSSWFVLLAGGMGYLLRYSYLPGRISASNLTWPQDTQLLRRTENAFLIIFLHPQCPCSRATLGELEKLVAKVHTKISVWTIFYQPLNESQKWIETDLWRKAKSIPFVTALIDKGGIEARRFGAETSGTTFLYDEKGSLVFRGGITPARGHMGDNPGEDTIRAWYDGDSILTKESKVFGCAIVSGGPHDQ